MQSSKFKLLSFLTALLFTTSSFAFTEHDCLNSSYFTEIAHKGFPMGLTENKLIVNKERCVVTIRHEKLRFLKKSWLVDVCREPVHIKEGTGTVNVLKRLNDCNAESTESRTAYCDALKEIQVAIQDDGLIFAAGEKENLSSDHGKVYCAYTIVRDYLKSGKIFSRHVKADSGMSNVNKLLQKLPIPFSNKIEKTSEGDAESSN